MRNIKYKLRCKEGKPKRPAEFWTCKEGEEKISHRDPDDAIHELLDDTPVVDWPNQIAVYGFAQMEPDVGFLARSVLEGFLEQLDEEYSDQEEGPTQATSGMQDAARRFVEIVLEDYDVWACEEVERVSVSLFEYLNTQGYDDLANWLGDDELTEVLNRFPKLKH